VLLVGLFDVLGDRRLPQTTDERLPETRRAAALAPEAARADRPDPRTDDRIGHSPRLEHPVDER
jgi:hypothetical protein